jgi:hypothetical protein
MKLSLAALVLLSAIAPAAEPKLDFHEDLVESWRAADLEVKDAKAVFDWVFRQLPAEVMVYPTENYYYWRLTAGGREIRGNFRPASGLRDQGILSFAYAEWLEFPDEALTKSSFSQARRFGVADGVVVTCPDAFSCEVASRGKTVRFRFQQIPQLPPPEGVLRGEERFVSRTWDESGLPFYLCYDAGERCFFWVLNEDRPGTESFAELAPGILLGRRTGFVFWVRGGAKILTAVRSTSVERNDYFDGPFDQLADNYAAQVPLRKYVEEAFPALKDQIDLYGYFTAGPDKGDRVALTSYLSYGTTAEALEFTRRAAATAHPVGAIAAGGKNR